MLQSRTCHEWPPPMGFHPSECLSSMLRSCVCGLPCSAARASIGGLFLCKTCRDGHGPPGRPNGQVRPNRCTHMTFYVVGNIDSEVLSVFSHSSTDQSAINFVPSDQSMMHYITPLPLTNERGCRLPRRLLGRWASPRPSSC